MILVFRFVKYLLQKKITKLLFHFEPV